MNRTKIAWTDFTANPVRYRTADGRVVWACEKLSAGCANCYAESLSHRYGGHRRAGDWNAATMATLTPFLDEKELREMLTSKHLAGKKVFVGDMTDAAGAWVPDEILDRMFAAMVMRPDVIWQLLTKRSERLASYLVAPFWANRVLSAMKVVAPKASAWAWPSVAEVQKHIHIGFSAENQATFDERWPHMAKLAAAGWTTFCSAEPLLAPINFAAPQISDWPAKPGEQTPIANHEEWDDWKYWAARDRGLRWVIVGLESGSDRRDCGVEPLVSIVRQCEAAKVAVFVKQDCALQPGQQGRIPDDVWKFKQFPNEAARS
jgi:protein gp37